MSTIKPKVPLVVVHVEDGDYEKATYTFVKLLLEAAKQEADSGEGEEPPVTRSFRLEESAEFLEDDDAIKTLYSVCKRINFDDREDKEREEKIANLKLLIISLRQQEKKKMEEEASKKRKRDFERQPRKLVRRTNITERYSKKMRYL